MNGALHNWLQAPHLRKIAAPRLVEAVVRHRRQAFHLTHPSRLALLLDAVSSTPGGKRRSHESVCWVGCRRDTVDRVAGLQLLPVLLLLEGLRGSRPSGGSFSGAGRPSSDLRRTESHD